MMLSQVSQPTVPSYNRRSDALFRAWDSFFVPFSKTPPLTSTFASVPCPTLSERAGLGTAHLGVPGRPAKPEVQS